MSAGKGHALDLAKKRLAKRNSGTNRAVYLCRNKRKSSMENGADHIPPRTKL